MMRVLFWIFQTTWIKQSDEYKKSFAYKLQEFFVAFNRESGYNEVFIPAMKRLSKSYREYYEALQKADKIFMQIYPNGISKL